MIIKLRYVLYILFRIYYLRSKYIDHLVSLIDLGVMGISFKSYKNQIKISVVLTAAASGTNIYIYDFFQKKKNAETFFTGRHGSY